MKVVEEMSNEELIEMAEKIQDEYGEFTISCELEDLDIFELEDFVESFRYLIES